MRTDIISLFILGSLLALSGAAAQEGGVEVELLAVEGPECLPNGGFAPVTVQLDSDENISSVRLYFRRLNPLGGFYYLDMTRVGAAIYSTVFPAPADRAQPSLTDGWWTEIDRRDWLEDRDRMWLEGWLAGQRHEAAEYFFAAFDVYGERVVQSRTQLVEVRNPDVCEVELTPRELEWTEGIAIGETMEAQVGLPPFHWRCAGVRDRIAIDGRVRPDRTCQDEGGDG